MNVRVGRSDVRDVGVVFRSERLKQAVRLWKDCQASCLRNDAFGTRAKGCARLSVFALGLAIRNYDKRECMTVFLCRGSLWFITCQDLQVRCKGGRPFFLRSKERLGGSYSFLS